MYDDVSAACFIFSLLSFFSAGFVTIDSCATRPFVTSVRGYVSALITRDT